MGASRTLPGARAFAQPDRPLTTIHHMLGEGHPSIISTASLNPLSSRPISSASLCPVPATNRSLTARLLVPPTPTLSPSGSRRVDTPNTNTILVQRPLIERIARAFHPCQLGRLARTRHTAGTVVAELFSQSNSILRSSPTRSTCACGFGLWVQPCVLRSCADCDGVRKALSLARPSAAHNERSKSRSAVRSVQSRRDAPRASGGRGAWPLMESARQPSSGRRSDAKSTV
jgi:hypothetical protein